MWYGNILPIVICLILHVLSVFTLPLMIGLLTGTSALVFSIVAFCTYKCWKAKRFHHSPPLTPSDNNRDLLGRLTTQPFQRGFRDINLKISQSTPDLIQDEPQSAAVIHEEEKIGRSHYKTVIKQTTLPTVPHRHMSFQRQLSHKLDLSSVEFTIHSVKYKEQPTAKLKPELYRQNAQEQQPIAVPTASTENVKVYGKIYFSLQYKHPDQTLIVTIFRAEDLPAKDFSGTSDPYVKVYLLPDRKNKFQTKVHRKTLNPQFDESFSFSVSYTELETRVLQFSIYDFDRFSRHDLIGIVMVRDIIKNCDITWEQHFEKDILCVTQVGCYN